MYDNDPPAPTLTLPGSDAKILTLRERAERGLPLHQPGDLIDSPDAALSFRKARNGRAVVDGEQEVAPDPGERRKVLPNGNGRDCPRVLFTWEQMLRAGPRGLGERVREFRRLKGWSLGQLSLEARLSRGALSRLERGRRLQTTCCALWALADAFGVTLDQLVGREPPRKGRPSA